MEFEGVPFVVDDAFNDNTYLEMRLTQKIELTYMFSGEARRLAFSRLMREPLAAMQTRVNELLKID